MNCNHAPSGMNDSNPYFPNVMLCKVECGAKPQHTKCTVVAMLIQQTDIRLANGKIVPYNMNFGITISFVSPEKPPRQMVLKNLIANYLYIFSNISTRKMTSSAIKLRENPQTRVNAKKKQENRDEKIESKRCLFGRILFRFLL